MSLEIKSEKIQNLQIYCMLMSLNFCGFLRHAHYLKYLTLINIRVSKIPLKNFACITIFVVILNFSISSLFKFWQYCLYVIVPLLWKVLSIRWNCFYIMHRETLQNLIGGARYNYGLKCAIIVQIDVKRF